jgi:hypothetical protein
MPTYLITNRAPKDYAGSPDAAAWTAWFDRLGASLEVGELTLRNKGRHPISAQEGTDSDRA